MTADLAWLRGGRRAARRLHERLGAIGLAGLGMLLLACALAFYTPRLGWQTEELRSEGARARGKLDDLQREGAQRRGSPVVAARLRESLPTIDQMGDDLRLVFDAAARNRVELAKGDYTLDPFDESSRLRRLDVTLPVRERYLPIKSFVAEVLNAAPHASLAELRIERHAANVEQLDARIRFTLFYRDQ